MEEISGTGKVQGIGKGEVNDNYRDSVNEEFGKGELLRKVKGVVNN